MINRNNLSQKSLFDPWERLLDEKSRKTLLEGWEGLFRMVLLEMMPVDTLAENFDPSLGRPTKELYSISGLILIKEFKNWTMDEAVSAYIFNENVHFALAMEPGIHYISKRSLERYHALLLEHKTAMNVFDSVTRKLIELSGIKTDKQRIDSTHLYSDMACFGRTKLMGMVIKKFLTQIKRHADKDYQNLPEEFRKKYEQSNKDLFTVKTSEKRTHLRQTIAEDLHWLIEHFADKPSHTLRTTYKNMLRVFSEQCTVEGDTIVIKKKTGGAVMQNPSDPDAGYDGKKGQGYQVQISETCNTDNEIQLVTAVLPQSAVESDTTACQPMLEQLEARDCLPKELSCDGLYGTDDNFVKAAAKGVELISPVKKGSEKEEVDPGVINISDFEFDEKQHIIKHCPCGHAPLSSTYSSKQDQTTTYFSSDHCQSCPERDRCPARCNRNLRGRYVLYSAPRKVRLTKRRLYNKTEAFKKRYRIRAGIEGTNSGLKRRTCLGRLRVRGKPGVFHSVILKVTGWNILRGSESEEIRTLVKELYEKQCMRPVTSQLSQISLQLYLQSLLRSKKTVFSTPMMKFTCVA